MKQEVAEQIRQIITDNQPKKDDGTRSAVVFVSLNDEKSLSIAVGGNQEGVFKAFANLAKTSPEIAEVMLDGLQAGLAKGRNNALDAAVRNILNTLTDDPCDCEDCQKAKETPVTDEDIAMAIASITPPKGEA